MSKKSSKKKASKSKPDAAEATTVSDAVEAADREPVAKDPKRGKHYTPGVYGV